MLSVQVLEGKRVIMEENSLGRRLAEARAERKWSLREVERRTGISNAHISQIETGGIERPAPNVLWALASVYELDLGDLMRMSGHGEAAAKATPGSVVGAALREMGELSPDEQKQALEYMKSLQKKGKGTGQQPLG
jgi:HTH-type transcriptional regulator, competence development regulator